MKFRMLLWYMARRMDLLARTHPEFIARLHGRDFVIQISTDEGAHRFFRVRHNRVESHNSVCPEPDLTMHFINNDVAFRLLSRGDANSFMTAVQAGEVKLIGDYALLMWFMGIGKYLRPARRGRSRREADAHRHAG
jgi:hypothetical protein